jgi:hypothetical protein
MAVELKVQREEKKKKSRGWEVGVEPGEGEGRRMVLRGGARGVLYSSPEPPGDNGTPKASRETRERADSILATREYDGCCPS